MPHYSKGIINFISLFFFLTQISHTTHTHPKTKLEIQSHQKNLIGRKLFIEYAKESSSESFILGA